MLMFVSGIPRGTKARELVFAFNKMRFKIRVSTNNELTEHSRSEIISGHCLICTRNRNEYENILNSERIFFDGRWLSVKPYLSGVELYRQNCKNNKRRILLKRVPLNISDFEIRDSLESKFGLVSELFCLMPDKKESSSHYMRKRKTRTYSVMFYQEVSSTFVNNMKLELRPGLWVLAEKFSVKKKKKKTACNKGSHLSVPDGNSQKNYLEMPDAKTAPTLKVVGEIVQSISNGSLLGKLKSVQQLTELPEQSDYPQHRRRTSVEGTKRPSNGYCRSEFINDLIGECHHLKPSTKIYRLLRGEDPEYLATFEHRYTWIAVSNLQVNRPELIR